MTMAENVAIVTRFYGEGVNERNWKVVEALLTLDFTHNGQRLGVDGQRRSLESLYAAFRDARVTLDETIAAGDRVVTRMTWSGIHGGAFRGITATGKRVTWSAISLIRVRDGLITEAWVNQDDLGLLLQIGATVQAAHH